LVAEPPEQAEQQLKQPSLPSLTRRVASGLAQARQEPGEYRPGRANQGTHLVGTEIGE
jgi:hypothetical protein